MADKMGNRAIVLAHEQDVATSGDGRGNAASPMIVGHPQKGEVAGANYTPANVQSSPKKGGIFGKIAAKMDAIFDSPKGTVAARKNSADMNNMSLGGSATHSSTSSPVARGSANAHSAGAPMASNDLNASRASTSSSSATQQQI